MRDYIESIINFNNNHKFRNMQELLKKFVHTGVGFVALASEKVNVTVEDLRKRGEQSEVEGEKIVKGFMKSTDKKKEELQDKIKSASTKVTKSVDVFGKSDYKEILKRIEKLEKKITVKSGTIRTKTVKAKRVVKK